jgi:hypothetical protein
MQDLEYMTKWMSIPQYWKDLTTRDIKADQTELRVCKEITSQAHLNMSICFYYFKDHLKAIHHAKISSDLFPSVKAFFR